VLVAAIGLTVLAAAVVGFLWLLQFVLNNEERQAGR
jgi:hypothetical protein